MKRHAINRLQEWKEDPNRLPLIIRGARQVGKTWLMQEFGRTAFERCAYINFDRNERMQNLFSGDFDVDRILRGLAIESGMEIDPENTLIILDEIQEVPAALQSLKYFCEDNRHNYYILAAGSLLGIAMHEGTSFPVGKVDSMDLYPLSFTEFLSATGNDQLLELLEQRDFGMVTAFRDKYIDLLRTYYYVGGMPAAVNAYLPKQNLAAVRRVQLRLISDYEQDFSKHAPRETVPRIQMVWDGIPSQLAKENKKFLYKVVKEGARAREYEDALQWLVDARLVHKVYRSTAPGLPVSAYDDLSAFKIYLVDVGLLRRLAQLAPTAFGEGNRLFTEFKGALTENFVLQTLMTQFEVMPRYWSQNNPPYEVDFLIQRENDIFPIEVKSETNIASKSLKKFKELFPDEVKLRIRFSLDNLKLDGDVLNIPLFLADHTDRLIGMALEERGREPHSFPPGR